MVISEPKFESKTCVCFLLWAAIVANKPFWSTVQHTGILTQRVNYFYF